MKIHYRVADSAQVILQRRDGIKGGDYNDTVMPISPQGGSQQFDKEMIGGPRW